MVDLVRLMSWHCSLALVEEFSERSYLDTASLRRLKSIRMREKSFYDAKKMGASRRSQCGVTATPLMGNLGVEKWMSSLGDSRAKAGHLQESSDKPRTAGTSGQPHSASSTKSDPPKSSLRTSQEYARTSEKLPETWPLWGMNRNGVWYQLEKPEHLISAVAGGALPVPAPNDWENIWPTVTTHDTSSIADQTVPQYEERLKKYDDKDYSMQFPLPTAVRFALEGKWRNEKPVPQPREPQQSWLSPLVTEWFGPGDTGKAATLNWQVLERHFAHHETYPTPTVFDIRGHNPKPRKETGKVRNDLLAQRLESRDKSWKLNADWTEWLMGWPIGWTSLDPLPQQAIVQWIVGMVKGTWWASDPADDPDSGVTRLCRDDKTRRHRIVAVGNGQVPAQLVLASFLLRQM